MSLNEKKDPKEGFVLCPICKGKGIRVNGSVCYFCLGDELVPKEKREEWWREHWDRVV